MRVAVRKKMHLQLTTLNLARFNLARAIRVSATQRAGRRICTAAGALVADTHQICPIPTARNNADVKISVV
jgi:hypothetical protein